MARAWALRLRGFSHLRRVGVGGECGAGEVQLDEKVMFYCISLGRSLRLSPRNFCSNPYTSSLMYYVLWWKYIKLNWTEPHIAPVETSSSIVSDFPSKTFSLQKKKKSQ